MHWAKILFKSRKKPCVFAVCCGCNFCLVGLRILSTTEFRLGKRFRYARLFSTLEYNFCPVDLSVNLVAMFLSEKRETRCRYAGATSEISGHGRVRKYNHKDILDFNSNIPNYNFEFAPIPVPISAGGVGM